MPTDLLPIAELKQLWQQAFREPMESIDLFFRTGFSPERCLYTQQDGKVVSALYWFDCLWEDKPLAYIYALATLAAHRGQGLAGRLLDQAHRHLAQKGYHGVILKPADGLFPYYEKQGYATSGYISHLEVETSSIPAPVKELSKEAYGALRRQYLPAGGVIQEGSALDFLHVYARFWEGPGCVLCTLQDEPVILEYLGDPNSAPGVLRALNIPKAAPITPGTDIPFLMYHPLTCSSEEGPSYLGLSLE